MTDTETLWQEISTAALLGAGRKPFLPSQAGGKLGAALDAAQSAQAADQPPGGENEASLLRAAAITTLHRRAGRLPTLGSPVFPAPAADDARPRCPVQVAHFLDQILVNGKLDLLAEWIELANQYGMRIREEHLPRVLEQHKAVLSLRRSLLPVLGERGRWLAALNPDWHTMLHITDERAWTEGPRTIRRVFLRDLREADPERARALLSTTWAEETPADKIAFLEMLTDGLAMADEPFLEHVLDDHRKDVRLAAADLLARLPESRLVQHMSERARGLLRWKPGLLRSSLEINLPQACDTGMQRDGIEAHPPAESPLGEKAWWLAQILAFVPPRTWSSAWNRRPGQILDMIRKSEWEEPLLEGWREAALRSADTDWLTALANNDYHNGANKRMYDLFVRLPAGDKERLVLSLLNDAPSLSYDQLTAQCLAACRHPWSPALTQAITSVICDTLQAGDMQYWRWEKLLREIPVFFHPSQLENSIQRIMVVQQRLHSIDQPVQNLLDVLAFRLDMHRAFRSSRPSHQR